MYRSSHEDHLVSSYIWREHPAAREELIAESDRLPTDIAIRFIEHAEAAIHDIIDHPDSWPKVHYWEGQPIVRWRVIRPFRIRVVYYVVDNQVIIIAYAHEAREPGYWKNRIA